MSELSLSDLKNQFKKEEEEKSKNSNSNNVDWYRFWEMAYDETAIVRFLPDADPNASHFLIEKHLHKLDVEIDGQTKKRFVPCLGMYNKPCPICAQAQKFYKEDDDKNGGKFYKKRSYIGQILIQKSPFDYEGSDHKLINMEPEIYEIIKKAIVLDDLDCIPTDYENGYDFRLNKTSNGKYASYSTSSFARKPSAVDMDKLKDTELYVLKDKLPREPKLEYVEAVLHAALTGEPFEWNNDDSGSSSTSSTDGIVASLPSDDATDDTVNDNGSDAIESKSTTKSSTSKSDSGVMDILARRRAEAAGK